MTADPTFALYKQAAADALSSGLSVVLDPLHVGFGLVLDAELLAAFWGAVLLEFDEVAVFVSEQPHGIVREPTPHELKEDAKGRAARGAGAGPSPAPEPEFRLEPVESTARSGNPNCAMWSCFPSSCDSCSEDAALRNDEEYSLVFERPPS